MSTGVPRSTGQRIAACLLLLGVATVSFLAFVPALRAEFVFDDKLLLVRNESYRGLDSAHLQWMLTNTRAAHWIPLTWLSYGLDFVLHGMDPYGYHLTNLILHALVAAMFARLAFRLLAIAHPERVRAHPTALYLAAGAAALLFAVHPLRAESVAWVTERRDVLGAFFLLPALLAWLRACSGEGPAFARPGWYATSLLLWTMALLAKSSSMTLVLVLVVLDLYPLRRLPLRPREWGSRALAGVWIEKLPVLAIGLSAASVAAWAVATMGQTLRSFEEWGLGARLAQVPYMLAFYVRKTLWPDRLAALYELPYEFDPLESRFVWSYVGVGIALLAIVIFRRRLPSLGAAAAAYVALLLPVLAVHAGPQIVTDRYSYLSCLPFALLAGGALLLAWSAWPTAARYALGAVSTAAIALLFVLTWKQTSTWRDERTLWTHALAVGEPSSTAHLNLGVRDVTEGHDAAAIEHFQAALALRPDHGPSWLNLGHMHAKQGRLDQAEKDYIEACRTMSPAWPAYVALGRFYRRTEQPERAIESLRSAVESADREGPENFSSVPHLELGAALQDRGRPGLARPYLETAARYSATRDMALRRLQR